MSNRDETTTDGINQEEAHHPQPKNRSGASDSGSSAPGNGGHFGQARATPHPTPVAGNCRGCGFKPLTAQSVAHTRYAGNRIRHGSEALAFSGPSCLVQLPSADGGMKIGMESDVLAHVVEQCFGPQIATPAEYADAVSDDLRRFGISADTFEV